MSALPLTARPERFMEAFTPEALPPELEAKLKAALPAEAVKPHPRIDGLSSINAAFVIDRMNEVFGIGAYQEKYEKIDVSSKEEVWNKGEANERKVKLHVATVHGTLTIPRYGIHLENFGGSDNQDLGDALKGACTDCFTKMCSHLGIGLDVYKSGREGAGKPELPPCPNCGKALRKSKDGDGYYCWTKKDGCGAIFTEDGLKAVQAAKEGQSKPPQSAQQSRPADPSKITIQGKVTDRQTDNGKLWLKVGERKCVTMQDDIKGKLKMAWRGAEVELLVSALTGQSGTFYQIHKVIGVKPAGGGQ